MSDRCEVHGYNPCPPCREKYDSLGAVVGALEVSQREWIDPLLAENAALKEEVERLKAEQGYDRHAALEALINSLKSSLQSANEALGVMREALTRIGCRSIASCGLPKAGSCFVCKALSSTPPGKSSGGHDE